MDIDQTLEAATADFFWVPDHVQLVERDALAYSFSLVDGYYNRVVRARPTLEDPQRLVQEVLSHHPRKSLWSLNCLSDTRAMRAALAQANYTEGARHFAFALEAANYTRHTPSNVTVVEVQTAEDLLAIYDLWETIFDTRPHLSEQALQKELHDCTAPDRRVARFLAYRDGTLAGTGGMTFFDHLDFALIWAGGVHPDHRGCGVYTALLKARTALASARGISTIGLYARQDTSAPIVAAHGFRRYGHMSYFERNAPAP